MPGKCGRARSFSLLQLYSGISRWSEGWLGCCGCCVGCCYGKGTSYICSICCAAMESPSSSLLPIRPSHHIFVYISFFSIEYIHSFLFALVQRNKMRLIICFAVCCVVKYFQLFIFLKNRGWIDFSVWIQSCFVECLGVREGDRYCRGKGAKAIQAHVCYSTPSTPRHHIVIAILPHPTPSIGALFHNFIFILFLFPFPLHYYFIPSLIICSFLILRFLLISG